MILKKIVFSIVSLGVGLVMWEQMKSTVPPAEMHLRKVTEVVEQVVQKNVMDRIEIPQESRDIAQYLTSEVIPKAISKLTAGKIKVTDFGVFSLGEISLDTGDETNPVTIGIFGKVFTLDAQAVRAVADNMVDEMRINEIIRELGEK